jgi:hypothetical protein
VNIEGSQGLLFWGKRLRFYTSLMVLSVPVCRSEQWISSHSMKPKFLFLVLLLLLTACGEAESPPVAATFTPEVAVNPQIATVTALPSTEIPSTSVPLPSATTLPTATTAATATLAPTATPDFLTNPPVRGASPGRTTNRKDYPPGAYEFIHDQFSVPAPAGNVPPDYLAALPGVPDGSCPLTGEVAPADITTRRPINVRVDNSADGRPQAGLENADVVWETLAEGGVTRLTATYHCRTIGTVGPIRSARLIDLQLTPMLEAWLIHVGASQPVTDMMWASPYADRSINEWAGDPAFYRINNPPVGWLSTYTNLNLIQGVTGNKANATLPAPLRGWQFSPTLPTGATGGATTISIPYFPNSGSVVTYRYNPSTGKYLRYQGQAAHTMQSGAQLAPDNVVVLYAPMTTTPIIEDSLGAFSLHFDIVGIGRALLLRNGQLWDAQWVREGENVLIRVVDTNGTIIPLTPGQTFVQIVEEGMTVSWE